MQLNSEKKIYRPDIDGLRALAVVSVIIFHFNSSLLPGGFAGVDIFFVISGYLITTNILKGVEAGSFSLLEFYRRRALRILPNLFFVVFVTLLAAHFIFQPKDYLELAYSALASILSVANIYFTYFLDTSYFAPGTNQQPLLHIWSLGVEEQFYLFWPLILLLAYKFIKNKKLIGWLAVLLCCASFIYAEAMIKSNPMFAYYMLPTRAGELLIGGLLAFYLHKVSSSFFQTHWLSTKLLSWCSAIVGLALIAYSLWFIDENKSFPGINALPSTLGAALIILAGSGSKAESNLISRFLSTKPVVLIGLLSYSLYLWHWPLMAFYRYMYGEIALTSGLVLFALMVIFSWIGYRYVEKPMRALNWNVKRTFFVGVFPAVGAAAFAVLLIHLSKGFGGYWFDDGYKSALAQVQPAPAAYSYDYVCQGRVSDGALANPDCIINGDSEPGILLWGDSNAAHYVGVLGSIAKEAGFSFRNIAHSSCPPFIEGADSFVDESRRANCIRSVEIVKRYVNKYSVVVLGGQWSAYSSKNELFFEHLEKTVDSLLLNGKQVVLLGRVPRFKNIDNECKAKELKKLFPVCPSQGDGSTEGINSYLKSVALNRKGVFYMDIDAVVCPAGICDNFMDGVNLYYDTGHLSMIGSWKIGEHIVRNGLTPDFFSHFKDTKYYGLENFLSAHIRDVRFKNLTDKDFQVRDSSTDAYGRIVIDDDDANQYTTGVVHFRNAFTENAIYKFTIASCDAFPMFRFRVKSEAKQFDHDVQIDCGKKVAIPRGRMGADDFYLESNGDNLVLYVKPKLSKDETLSIVIYAASGQKLGSYSKQATGSIAIETIGVADI